MLGWQNGFGLFCWSKIIFEVYIVIVYTYILCAGKEWLWSVARGHFDSDAPFTALYQTKYFITRSHGTEQLMSPRGTFTCLCWRWIIQWGPIQLACVLSSSALAQVLSSRLKTVLAVAFIDGKEMPMNNWIIIEFRSRIIYGASACTLFRYGAYTTVVSAKLLLNSISHTGYSLEVDKLKSDYVDVF